MVKGSEIMGKPAPGGSGQNCLKAFSRWRKKKKAHIHLTIFFTLVITPFLLYDGLSIENKTLALISAGVYGIGMLLIVLLG